MVYMRVLKPFEYRDQQNSVCNAVTGTLVDVMTTTQMNRLVSGGFVTTPSNSSSEKPYSDPAMPFAATKRIGIWLTTTPNYSGGRIYMYQIAHTLAQAGCEVWLITDGVPAWAGDFPPAPNLKVFPHGEPIPPDLDIVFTDSKQLPGQEALEYKKAHPNALFVCMNFESPNWVELYVPEYARQLVINKDVFAHADHFLACSRLGAKYLLEWIGKDNMSACKVIRPAVNNYALDRVDECVHLHLMDRPFAVWSARSSEYKGGNIALEAIMELDFPFDIVTFGDINKSGTADHKIISMRGFADVEKYAAMKRAHMVLAPSLFEGYGMVPGEALAVGTPCICYDLPVLREEYGDLDLLHYVPWGDRDAFKAKVKELAGKEKQSVVQEAKITGTHVFRDMKAMDDQIQTTIPYFNTRRVSITANLLSYWGVLPESLESVAPYCDQIIICDGPVPHALKVDDGSYDRVRKWIDESGYTGEVIFERRDKWESKIQMREFAARKATGNHFLVLDGDEIWVGLDKWLSAGIKFGSPRFVHFWHSTNHWIHDGPNAPRTRWGRRLTGYGSVCPVYRWSWWRPTYSFSKSHVGAKDAGGNWLHKPDGMAAEQVPEAVIYHLGHAFTAWLTKVKHEFYQERDAQSKDKYLAWMNWADKVGDCGDGIVEAVDWELPEIVERAYATARNIQVIEEPELVSA